MKILGEKANGCFGRRRIAPHLRTAEQKRSQDVKTRSNAHCTYLLLGGHLPMQSRNCPFAMTWQRSGKPRAALRNHTQSEAAAVQSRPLSTVRSCPDVKWVRRNAGVLTMGESAVVGLRDKSIKANKVRQRVSQRQTADTTWQLKFAGSRPSRGSCRKGVD